MLSIVPGRLHLLLHGGAGQVGDQAGRGGRGRLPGRLGAVLRVDRGDRRFVRTAEGMALADSVGKWELTWNHFDILAKVYVDFEGNILT